MKKFIVAFFVLWTTVANAQWQVPSGSVPTGKGPGVIGFGGVAPGSNGNCLVSNGSAWTSNPCATPGSVYTNIVSTKTGAYPAVTGDCGTTLALGGNAKYSLTLAAVGSYVTNCLIIVKNTDTTREKLMVVNGLTNRILWPSQSITYAKIGAVWLVINDPGMFILPAGVTTFNVANAGTDTDNGCLGTGAGACATFQHALDLAAQFVNVNQQQFYIQGTPGETYNESIRLRNLIGTTTDYTRFPPRLKGGTGLGATLNCGGGNCIEGVNSTSGWYIEGFTMINGNYCIYADNKSIIFVGQNVLTCTAYDMVSSFGSTLEILEAWTSNGNKTGIMEAINSSILISVGLLTLGGNTTTNFAVASENSYLALAGLYNGTTTQITSCLVAVRGGGIETNSVVQPCTAANTTGAPAWIH